MEISNMTMRMTVALLSAALTLPAQKPDAAESLLQAAVKKEIVDGDLAAAIEGYKKALAAAKGNRTVAAKALYQLGECYQKQGNASARQMFERLLKEYGDQPIAAEARARLAAMSPASSGDKHVAAQLIARGGCNRVSADGAFCTMIDEIGNVALRDLRTGEIRRVTTDGTIGQPGGPGGAFPVASRDGKQIAYFRSGELRVINADGTGERTVPVKIEHGDSFTPSDWFPDGKSILARGSIRKTPFWGIARIELATGAVRELKNVANIPVGQCEGGTVSPDGRWVIYARQGYPGMDWDVFAIDAQTGEESEVLMGPSADYNPEWTPDGQKVVFRSDRNGKDGIWIASVQNGRAAGAPLMIRPDLGDFTLKGISRDGSLFYVLRHVATDVYRATVDPQNLRVEDTPSRAIETFVGHNETPSWAPSGDSFAYVSERDKARRLVIRHSDGKEVLAADLIPAWPFWPHWCGGGDRLLYFGLPAFGRIRAYDARTGDASQPDAPVTGLRAAYQWGASPDCKSVYVSHYSYEKKQRRIYRNEISTGTESDLLIDGGDWAAFPVASPDGRWLALLGKLEGGNERGILILPAAGGPLRMLAPGGGGGFGWTPDSRGLMYGRKDDLFWVPVEGGAPRPMGIRMPGINFPSLNSDGRRLLFQSFEGFSELWVLRNLSLK